MAAFDIEIMADIPLPEVAPTAVGRINVMPQTLVQATYRQRAYNTALSQYVYWTTYGYPDITGAASGYATLDLTNITVLTRTVQ